MTQPLRSQGLSASSQEVTTIGLGMPIGDPAFMNRHDHNPRLSQSELEDLARRDEASRKRRAEEYANPPRGKRPKK